MRSKTFVVLLFVELILIFLVFFYRDIAGPEVANEIPGGGGSYSWSEKGTQLTEENYTVEVILLIALVANTYFVLKIGIDGACNKL